MRGMVVSYQSLWMMTQELVESVQKEDWDGMVLIRDQREGLLDTLKGCYPEDWATVSNREEIADLIGKTLILEEEIKKLLETKMSTWQRVLNIKRKMEKSYGVHSC